MSFAFCMQSFCAFKTGSRFHPKPQVVNKWRVQRELFVPVWLTKQRPNCNVSADQAKHHDLQDLRMMQEALTATARMSSASLSPIRSCQGPRPFKQDLGTQDS